MKFCDGQINKFCLMLWKGVYCYKYIDSWETFNKTSLSDKNAFYSSLNMKDTADEDYGFTKIYKKSTERFEIEKSRWLSWFEHAK